MDRLYKRTGTAHRKNMHSCNATNKVKNWVEDIGQVSSRHRKPSNTPGSAMLHNQTDIRYRYRSNFKMPISTLWKTFILYSVCALVVTAQSYVPNINEEDFEDPYHTGGDNVHLFAVTGHLFNRPIAEELKSFDPELLSDEDHVTVHFPISHIPGSQWMVFRQESGLLQGIALPEHEGVTNIYVTVNHAKSSSESSLTLPCVVEVLSADTAMEMSERFKNHPRLKIDAPRNCPHHETQTIATVTLNIQPNALNRENRIEIVKRLSNFFDISCRDVTLHTSAETMKQHRHFLSGPGNIPKLRTHRGDRAIVTPVTLSWSLGCSSDVINDIPGLDKLETSAIDGSLAQAIGYDITEWQIGNSIHYQKALHRRKRSHGKVPSSAGINYPRASRLSDPGNANGETIATSNNNRAKVANDRIRATPTPSVPIRARKIATSPLDRTYEAVPPSTPYVAIPKTPSNPEPVTSSNDAPIVFFGMENVHAIKGTYMEFRIPSDTFLDNEDGMTRSLKLQIMDLTTTQMLEKDGQWPLFDSTSQLLYGVPMKRAAEETEYMIAAEDSGGKSSSLQFTLYVDDDKEKPISHKFTYVFSESPENAINNPQALYTSFGKKLSVALAKTESMPGTLAMVKLGLTKNNELYVIWFDRMYNHKTKCESVGIREQATLMIGPDAATGRNKPAREFAAKFKPEFKLKSIKIDLLGPCYQHTTTTPITTTTTTITTTTSTPTMTTTKMPTIIPPVLLSTTITSTTSRSPSSTSTTTMKTKTSTQKTELPPSFAKPIPKISTEVGNVKEFTIPEDVFGDTKDIDDVIMSLPGTVPSWINFDSKSRTLCIMPTQDEVINLKEYNTTHRVWKGSLLAKNKDGIDSTATQLEVYVKQGVELDKMKVNHKFHIKIKNYDLKNFTASDRIRLVRLISEITGDKTGKSLYLRSFRAGSVLFSWHNSTLAYSDPCPFIDIAKLARKFFDGNNFIPDVRDRFLENNFTVSVANLVRSDWCTKTPVTSPKTTTDNLNLAGVGAQGKMTTVIIVAVVIVCIVLLIIILVLKCRMGQKKHGTKKEEQDKLEREEAAIAAANPDNSETLRIKKGVPIILQDEIGLEANGEPQASPTTPLMSSHRGNGAARHDHDDDIREETAFNAPHNTRHPMTPPTPVMSDRPPPPYTKTR